jgi:gamma-D-glutamyl-L-lysine dipeptidyl-peptidase
MVEVICVVPVAPLRAEGSHRAEMVSQILFGETAQVLSETKDFYQIQMRQDGYEGWCQKLQLQVVAEGANVTTAGYTANWINTAQLNGQNIQLPLGTPIVSYKHTNFELAYTGAMLDAANNAYTPEALENLAKQFLGTAYLWGGRSVFGIDCSGFVQMVFKLFNCKLPRDAYQQAEMGEAIGFLAEAKTGDLAFFDNEQGNITHVGILLAPNLIIHASAMVRIDPIDQAGIVSSTTGLRTHQLRTIRRIIL